MAETGLKPSHPWGDLKVDDAAPAGCWARPLCHGSVASISARRGQLDTFAQKMLSDYGIDPPQVPRIVRGKTFDLVGAGPESWLAVDNRGGANLASDLAVSLRGIASVCDQSDGLLVMRLGGPDLAAVMAKGLPLDLHPQSFAADAAATTTIAHIGATLWRRDDQEGSPVIDIAVFRSMAGSFWHWLSDSAAEFGLAVRSGG